ncbi:DUF2716 domain-containing protein [Streptomyces sp. DHE7-1]|nr:DUF2716 domain-containing protein [Streptomyces sp. DHE7-1]
MAVLPEAENGRVWDRFHAIFDFRWSAGSSDWRAIKESSASANWRTGGSARARRPAAGAAPVSTAGGRALCRGSGAIARG